MEQKPFKPFLVSCGLKEGYESSGRVHTTSDARNIIQRWMETRLKQQKKITAGTLLEGQFIYPQINGEEISSTFEPAIHYKGIIREDASDEEALEMLEDLATDLAKNLNQKRVHVQFGTSYFIIERP
ncbi:MAG: hypothetical protein NTX72_05470 [Candidatus Uhrbacteria bacterium]|nr:hypothetical protein [Candidatus Uhrbacteria bacterium]